MGVLLPNYPEENVVKRGNVSNFSKMNGDRTRNGTAHGTSHGMQSGISYVNTRNSTGSGTQDSTSNVFQILNNIQKRQRAVQCQYNSSMVPTAPEMETPFRTTTPSAPAAKTVTVQQANPVHVSAWGMQNTSWSGPPADRAHVHKPPKQFSNQETGSLEKSPAPTQWKDFCE